MSGLLKTWDHLLRTDVGMTSPENALVISFISRILHKHQLVTHNPQIGQRKWPEEKLPVGLETIRNFNVRAKVVGSQVIRSPVVISKYLND
jgi:hypothetical protein